MFCFSLNVYGWRFSECGSLYSNLFVCHDTIVRFMILCCRDAQISFLLAATRTPSPSHNSTGRKFLNSDVMWKFRSFSPASSIFTLQKNEGRGNAASLLSWGSHIPRVKEKGPPNLKQFQECGVDVFIQEPLSSQIRIVLWDSKAIVHTVFWVSTDVFYSHLKIIIQT